MRLKLLKYIVIAGILLISGSYAIISINANGRVYNDDIPYRTYGLLLGTSPITPYGTHNYYFDKRIDAAAKLFNKGKVRRIIASGGDYSSHNGCNELTAMRDSLIKRGVPNDAIILDYQGTRTKNSIVYTKSVCDSVIIISQQYHNERALYLADHFRLNAIAYNAEMPKSIRLKIKNLSREFLARIKMFWEVLTD